MNPRIALVIGTRPEAIKLAPVAIAARDRARPFDISIISTGQHRELLPDMLDWFGLEVDHCLDLMRPDQTLGDVTSRALLGLEGAFSACAPDLVLVQGDTTSAFAGALAAFYQRLPVAHVEAGLRTYDSHSPYPEEINRQLVTRLADLHFAPTALARDNLLSEGIGSAAITVTGNTAIDALLWTSERVAHRRQDAGPMMLVTMHRRENHGEPLRQVCSAVLQALERHPALRVEFPLHPNPHVRATVLPLLGSHPRIELVDPLPYPDFVAAMMRSTLILSDSGGIQEEAPMLRKPVLILREHTERPEGVEAGCNRLVGTRPDVIVAAIDEVLEQAQAPSSPELTASTPYGDGLAAGRILDTISRWWRGQRMKVA